MTLFLCLLSFLLGVEVRKPCIAFCMRSVYQANRRMHKYMMEANRLKKFIQQKTVQS